MAKPWSLFRSHRDDSQPVVKAEALHIGGAVRTPDVIQGSLEASGMDNTADMGPGRPLTPYRGYSQQPRRMDYPVGVNISSVSRAAWHRPAFSTLKAIIDAYDVARMCINHKIDELRSMEPMFLPADGVKGDLSAAIDAAKTAMAFPDRELPFDAWLHKFMESVYRYDAGTLYRRRDYDGNVIGLESLDGTTIAPYVDEHGRRPLPPSPAYFQTVHGQIWNWYTSDDIIYTPFRPQSDSPYGLAPIESVLLTANTDLRFQWWFLQTFTEGSVPAAYGELPPDRSNPDQVAEWQDYWDAVIEGDQSQQHKIKWVPAGTKITAIQDHEFTSDFPEYLMSRTSASFRVLPQDLGLVKDVNRANGETQTDIQFRVNTLPDVRFFEGIVTRYLQIDLGLPVKMNLDTGRDKEDRLAEAQAWKVYIDSGMASPDEGRSELLGLPIDNQRPTPRFYNARTGPVPLLAIEGVAGKTDPETYGPAQGQPVSDQPFVGPIGVIPAAGTSDATAALAATDAMQVQQRQAATAGDQAVNQTPPAAPALTVVKAAATEGVTTETGIVGVDLVEAELDADNPDDTADDGRKEISAFTRFAKSRQKQGKWRPFEFTDAINPVIAHRLNDVGRAAVRKAAGELVAAGLVVQAADTGRVLMIQRALDPVDPASGMWEFPGGHIEDGESPFAAAVREWQEEVGRLLPAEAVADAYASFRSWTSDNGIYCGILLTVPAETTINLAGRGQVTNPDDPDGDQLEAIAWWDPATIWGNPLIRAELAQDQAQVEALLVSADVIEVEKSAGDAGPKARSWRDSADKTPQHRFDLRITDHYAPKVTSALWSAFPKSVLREAADRAAHLVLKDADPALSALRSSARAILAESVDQADLERTLRQLIADAYASGAHAAAEQAGPAAVTPAGVGDIDWSDWEPGDPAAGDLASDGGLADLLADAGQTVQGITGTLLDQLGNTIGDGLTRGDSIDGIADALGAIVDDPSRAVMIAHTETARAQSSASLETYRLNGIAEWAWILSDDACVECEEAADNGPYSVDDAAAPSVPLHPYCRCSTTPVVSATPVDDVPEISEPGE